MSVRDSSTCCNCHKYIVMGDNRTKNLTVVHLSLIRRMMLVNALSDAGPQNAVFQSRNNDRCSASKADCVAVVDMCISAEPVACWASYSYFRLFCFVYLHSFSEHSLRLSGTSSSSCPKTVTIGSSAGSDHKFSFQLFSQNQMFALVNCINFDWTQSICWDLILDHGCNARSLSFISNKGPEWIGASSSSAWCGMYGTDEMEG